MKIILLIILFLFLFLFLLYPINCEPISGPLQLHGIFKIQADNGDTNNPYFEFNDNTNKWVFSNDGVTSGSAVNMLKSIYDSDDDNRIDFSESLNDGTNSISGSNVNDVMTNTHTPATIGTKIIDESGLSDGDVLKYDSNSGNWLTESLELNSGSSDTYDKSTDYTLTISDCSNNNTFINDTANQDIIFMLPDAVPGYNVRFKNYSNTWHIDIKAYAGNDIQELDVYILNGKRSSVQLICVVADTWTIADENINNNIFYVGGDDASAAKSDLFKMNSVDGKFSYVNPASNLPSVRTRGEAFTYNGYAYWTGGTYNLSADNYSYYRYYPATETWSLMGNIINNRHNHVSFVLKGYAYISGGYNSSVIEYTSLRFNGSSWSYSFDLYTGTVYASCFVLNNCAYIVGGYTSTGASSSTVLYDGFTRGSTGSLPSSRYQAIAFAINGKGYHAGGYDGSGYTDDTFEFTLGTIPYGSWSALPAASNTINIEGVREVIVSNNVAYAIGGYVNGAYTNRVDKFDPISKTWSYCLKNSLYANRRWGGVFIINN